MRPRITALLLAGALVLAAAAPASALTLVEAEMVPLILVTVGQTATPKLVGLVEQVQKQLQPVRRISQEFRDLGGYEWALAPLTKAYVKGYFRGRGPGVFDPGSPITRQEAAVVVVRVMGREPTAAALTAADTDSLLTYTDAAAVAPWARNQVAFLAAAGALPAGGSLEPGAPASRLWVATLLVRALGYAAEAQLKAGVALPFKDGGAIPAELVGYVAAAVDHKLVSGYPDGEFKPAQTISRVEMAVLLGRAHNQRLAAAEASAEHARGTVMLATSDALLLDNAEIPLVSQVPVLANGREASLAAVGAGARVEAVLDQEGRAILLEVLGHGEVAEFTATVTRRSGPAPGRPGLAAVALQVDGREAIYSLAVGAPVVGNVQPGARVQVRTYAGLVTRMEVAG